MSNEANIIRSGTKQHSPQHIRRRRNQLMEQEMSDTAFRQEQAIKKKKIGDATAVVADQAEAAADSGAPMTKKQLAQLAVEVLSQMNFEVPSKSGKMIERDPSHQGSQFSLPEYGYYMDLIELATEGIPIESPKGNFTTKGVKPETPERFRNVFEGGLKKARNRISDDPELKEVLPQYVKEQQQGRPVHLGVPKLDNFTTLSQFLDRHNS